MGKPVFQRISGWSPNRLFEDAGGQKHEKGRSKQSLFETFSVRVGFLKNVLPPTRELHSQGLAPPKSDSKLYVFCEVLVEGALKPHFCDFWRFGVPGQTPKISKKQLLGLLGGMSNLG